MSWESGVASHVNNIFVVVFKFYSLCFPIQIKRSRNIPVFDLDKGLLGHEPCDDLRSMVLRFFHLHLRRFMKPMCTVLVLVASIWLCHFVVGLAESECDVFLLAIMSVDAKAKV